MPEFASAEQIRNLPRSGAFITDSNGNVIRQVKNLGWLLKHWKQVKFFRVYYHNVSDCVLQAVLNNGTRYLTTWESRQVMTDWLHRPVFRGLSIYWVSDGGKETKA